MTADLQPGVAVTVRPDCPQTRHRGKRGVVTDWPVYWCQRRGRVAVDLAGVVLAFKPSELLEVADA